MKHFQLIAGLLIFLGFATLVVTKPISQDEGVFLTMGKYIQQGQLPYQDFFDHKPPGIHFLFAGLFSIFGANLWIAKAALVISVFLTALLVVKVGELVKSGAGLLASIIFLFLLTQFEGFYLIAEPFLLLPLLLSIGLLFKKKNNVQWLFVAGASLALVPMFKQTAVVSVIPVLFLLRGVSRRGIRLFMAGFLAPWILLAAYLLAHGIADDAWHQAIVLTFTSYPRESLGYVLNMLHHNFLWTLPMWVLLLLGASVPMEKRNIVWALVLLPLPFMFFRHYAHYWIQIVPFVAIIAAAALISLQNKKVMFTVLVFILSITGGKIGQDAIPNWKILDEQLRVTNVLESSSADIMLAENQFSGFYFLLPQQPLNKYLYLTEVTEPDQAEQRTIEDLIKAQKVMILWPIDSNFAYAKRLQRVISQDYRLTQSFPRLGMDVWEAR